MRKISALLVMSLILGATLVSGPSLAGGSGGSGTCGKGKIWDPETKRCVPKPRGSGSGSHAF